MESKIIPLIYSELTLSLYPQLIKLIPTSIDVQVAIRCITYSLLALIGYCISKNTNTTTTTTTNTNTHTVSITNTNILSFTITSIVMGLVNITHIFSSYLSYSILSSGVGYSIFYIYPIFNLLGRTLFYNEKINKINYIYMISAILGVYLIYKNHKTESELDINDILKTKNTTIGVIAGIVSALTESIIYFMVKDNPIGVSPFIQLFKTYLFGGIVSIIYLIHNIATNMFLDLDYNYWITLILFNAIIGFVGYLLRFIMIAKLPTLLFNSLIFIGVIFSYMWGYVLSNEPITYNNISGTLLILMSIFLINKS